MVLNRSAVLIVLLLMICPTWGAVILSNNNIECCSTWQSAVIVTDSNNEPIPKCPVYLTITEIRGGIDTTLGKSSYLTDSTGKAILSYVPKRPGERLKISVSCGENKVENMLSVTGVGQSDTPQFNLQLPDIETSQIIIVVFLLFAGVFVYKGRTMMSSFRKATAKREPSTKKEDLEELEMSPRHLILDHERKMAARLARKHKRKEIRLDHDFMRKL